MARLSIGTGSIVLFLLSTLVSSPQSVPVFKPDPDDPRINYRGEDTTDPVSRLSRRIAHGEVQLQYSPKFGYLLSFLKELGISVTSQSLVFSKTSLQVDRISPAHPRALFFNDDVYVGLVRGGPLEFMAVDPQKGATFYILDQKANAPPVPVRKFEDCWHCHMTANTLFVPGFLARSVHVTREGEPLMNEATFLTDHTSALAERLGGWYVTGATAVTHMGNATSPAATATPLDFKRRVDLSHYPAQTSDAVALMVLDHQLKLHNLITRLGYEAKLNPSELAAMIERTLRYLLFIDEAPLNSPVSASDFRTEFENRGPKDGRGRSLRDFNLKDRLFRYPCSFLIYSQAFDSLPPAAKDPLLRRLWQILSGEDRSPSYSSLSPTDRRAVLEILVATKPSLPEYFRAGI